MESFFALLQKNVLDRRHSGGLTQPVTYPCSSPARCPVGPGAR